MSAAKTTSSIVFVLIMLIVIYGAIKLFVLKEPTGIDAIDKLIPGTPGNLLFAVWERNDDPSSKILFLSNGSWKSNIGSGTFTSIGSKCLKMDFAQTSQGSLSSYYIVVRSVSEDELDTAECPNSCSGCDNPAYRYHKSKGAERKMLKEFKPDHALD